MLIGIGIDSHKFEEETSEKSLVLGGIEIEGHLGLKAHSDGDVILHALFNAISSALGNRSIGYYHSDKAAEKYGISSVKYMETVKDMMEEKKAWIKNISIVVEAKKPKLEKWVPKMKRKIGKIFEIDSNKIGITLTSGEELTPFGKGNGIRVSSIVMLKNE